jgi:hypothetical protein
MRGTGPGQRLLQWGRAPAIALLVLAAAAAASAQPSADAASEALARANEKLRAELELARDDVFYLRLDPGRRVLELLLRGVVLGRYSTIAVERGTPRVAFWSRERRADWDGRCYSAGQLEPARERDRIELLAPAGEPATAPSSPVAPPTAEESVSVPARWRVVFAEGLSLEVRSPSGARHRGRRQRLGDVLSLWRADWQRATSRDAGDRVWLRVQLASQDAASLYRSLPPGVALVVHSAAGDPATP